MADNVAVTPTTSYTVAADDIAGVHHQRVKIGIGPDGTYGDVNATNPVPVTGPVTVSGTVTVNGTVTQANGASVTIQQGASVSAVVSGTVTVAGSVSVNVINTIVTQLGTQIVSVVPGLSVSAVVSGTVTALMTTVVSGTVTVGGTVTVATGTVALNIDVTTATPGATATGAVMWVANPGAATSVVSGTVTALLANITTTQAAVTGVVVWLAPTQTISVAIGASTAIATTTQAAVTGAVAWLAPTQTLASVNVINTIVTQLGTQIVSVVPGLSVSAVVSGTVTVINPVCSTIVTILGTQVVTVVPGLSVSAVVSGTVTVLNQFVTTTQAAVTGLVVWLAPTQTLSVNVGASTALATTTQAAVTGAVVWMAPTQSVALVSTIVTILGTQIVSVAGGTTVVSGTVTAINSGILFTAGLPAQASTAQIVVAKPAPMQYVQIVVTSTAIAQSAGKYLFTIWTGATGAPAAAGTTSWAVPAGQVLQLRALQAAITSSAVLGGTVQVFVGVGATASMVSASIQTQLQVLKLQLLGGAAIDRAQLFGHQADIPAGESIAVFIVASTAAVLRDLVIGGNIY